jgi:manganese/zinc/iron transport system permease protein
MVGIERTGRLRPDTAIGVVLAGFFSLGIVLLTAIAGTGDADQAGLERYLFGQAAGITEGEVTLMAALGGVALAVVAVAFRALKTTLFDPSFAAAAGLRVRLLELLMTALLVVAVVIGVRSVGAILMVAMLVVPAATARQLTRRFSRTLPVAGLVGAVVGVSGALLASAAEVPTGPVIVLVGTAVVIAAILLAPGRGVAWRARRVARDGRRAHEEAALLALDAAAGAGVRADAATLAAAGGHPAPVVRRALAGLRSAGLAREAAGTWDLTADGRDAARAAHERRALWGAWLEHGWRLELPDAREPDPRDLPGSLGPDAARALRAHAEAAA